MDLKKLLARKGPGEDPNAATLWTTPWTYRTTDGVYVGHNGQVWLYRVMPLSPLEWEDPRTRLEAGDRIGGALREIGRRSKGGVPGFGSTAEEREIHLVSHTWEAPAVAPTANSDALVDYQAAFLQFTVPHKVLFIGVRLTPGVASNGSSARPSTLATAKMLVTRALAQEVPDLDAYERDQADMSRILAAAGARIPSRADATRLESWFNNGNGTDATCVEYRDHVAVAGATLEMAAVMAFNDMNLHAPFDQWAAEVAAHEDAPHVVSVRATLQPASVARSRARRSQKRIKDMIEEQRATGDLDRGEDANLLEFAEQVEQRLVDGGDAILANCSIVLARRRRTVDETYADFLRIRFGIDTKPLEHRQMPALDETLPCSNKRINPFLQDLDVDMLAFAGLHAYSDIGDRRGCYVGLVDPDMAPSYIDPLGASRASKPASTAILGDSGSGKTHLMQSLCLQAALGGQPVIVVNPKGYDSLASFTDLAAELGVAVEVIKMSAVEHEPGAFDPFRYAPPAIAAEIATENILSVLGAEWPQSRQLSLGQGLKRASLVGAGSVGDALRYVDDPVAVEEVYRLCESSATFALGVSPTAREPFAAGSGITLIEFDRKLPLPSPGKPERDYSMSERIAVSAVRLVARASMEILNQSKATGGVFALDEAWTFLGNQAGLDFLDQLSREARSLNIWPIFITQRVGDVLKRADLGPYLSRVIALQMKDPADQVAALGLIGLEATEGRKAWLAQCGPVEANDDQPGRWPMALYRDLRDRHSAVLLGPTPAEARKAFSTTPDVRRAREAEAELIAAETLARETEQARRALLAAGFELPAGAPDVAQAAHENPWEAARAGRRPAVQAPAVEAQPPVEPVPEGPTEFHGPSDWDLPLM